MQLLRRSELLWFADTDTSFLSSSLNPGLFALRRESCLYTSLLRLPAGPCSPPRSPILYTLVPYVQAMLIVHFIVSS